MGRETFTEYQKKDAVGALSDSDGCRRALPGVVILQCGLGGMLVGKIEAVLLRTVVVMVWCWISMVIFTVVFLTSKTPPPSPTLVSCNTFVLCLTNTGQIKRDRPG